MASFIAEIRQHKFVALQIGLLALVSLGLRLWDLGYSDFQGDEIKALCSASQFSSFFRFLVYLLNQRKGPVQYVATCLYSLFDPGFAHEWAARLPFALANLLAMALLLLLVWRLFRPQIAIYASFILAVDGIFIAFARIVQYQSFVILAVVTALLALTLAVQSEKWRAAGLYLGFLAAAGGLLTHFDAAFVLPPMGVLLWHWWRTYRGRPDFPRLRLHLLAALALFAALLLPFYAEYIIHLVPYQTDYWTARFTGESTDIIRLFQFYNPGPAGWLFLAAVIIGATRIRLSVNWQVILAWLLPPLIFMGVIFRDSRTHAYTYLLPLMIVAGVGCDVVIGWAGRLLRGRGSQVAQAVALAVFLVLGYLSYAVLIDHHPEYPWYPKRVLGTQLQGGELTGTFGFPYARHWREVAAWFQALPGKDLTVVTNENDVITAFYLPSEVALKYLFPTSPGHVNEPEGLYFLVVQGPQSWRGRLWGWSLDDWRRRLVPLTEFRNRDGQLVASVYYLSQEQLDARFP